ncbi:MAG: hypothetical protein ABI333_13065 [bacterium]
MTFRARIFVANLALLLAAGAATGCGQEAEELPTYPVTLRLGGALPPDGQIGEYTVTLEQGWVVLGDWWLYGMDRAAAGFAHLVPPSLHKHAGHSHGDAAMETNIEGTFAVSLVGVPAVVATRDLTEGHYFDGSLRLRPCTELYAPVHPEDQTLVTDDHELWGHTLALSGTAARGDATPIPFQITVDAEAMVAGIVYGGTVWEQGATTITTRLDLAALLADLDFEGLAGQDGAVILGPSTAGETYDLLKARLQDPALYLHEEAEEVPE